VSPAAAERPRLLIVAGPNGAGKTTVTEAGLAHQWFDGCEYVNPDLIAQRELGDWNDPKAVLEAAQLATERREACLRDGRSLAFETVFSSPDKIDFVRRGIAAGFFVRLFFVGWAGQAATTMTAAIRKSLAIKKKEG
jgi:predicted ABC-type ATPase